MTALLQIVLAGGAIAGVTACLADSRARRVDERRTRQRMAHLDQIRKGPR